MMSTPGSTSSATSSPHLNNAQTRPNPVGNYRHSRPLRGGDLTNATTVGIQSTEGTEKVRLNKELCQASIKACST